MPLLDSPLRLLPVLAIAAAPAAAQLPTEWDIQIQCRSSLDANIPPFNLPFPSSLSSQQVTIDADGSVAIRAVLATGSATEGIFFGHDGTGGLILEANDPDDPVWSSGISLANGRIAIAPLTFDNGAFVIDTDGNPAIDYPPGGPQGVDGFGSLTMLDDGGIGYRARFGSFQKHIIDEYDAAGGRVQTLYAETTGSDFDFLFSASANNARQMASKALTTNGRDLIYRFERDGSRTIIAGPPDYDAFVNSVDLADSGLVAFNGRRTIDGVREIAVGDGPTRTHIASPGEAGIIDDEFAFWPPALNSDGWTVFRAQDAVGEAVFIGDGDTIVRIAGDGDVLPTDLGPMVMGFDFGGFIGRQAVNGPVAINEAGQVAFAAFLENGTIGVFVATPPAGCAADLDGDGDVDVNDFFFYLDLFARGDGRADINGDGEIDVADFFDYLDLFASGC